ncbi:hypothetical protein, conserved [Thermococcus onnurineus NA1]|uniref:Uncharacterized protein n=1 Tax=Thermococcus onnurineus (strain NA1) TaxID=523850 RepID=B6YWT6_THEON|nr:hypothetical protein [Thermococcus onnurineus]ACJ16549.1 hypothetical protein, conserved [Thermococcus onnurineus NA1]
MKVRLGYPDRIVEVDDKAVHVFNGKLVSAPLSEVVKYYLKGEGLLPPSVKAVVPDIIRVLLSTGELHGEFQPTVEYGQGLSG